jgi:ribosome-associated protein
MLGDRSTTKEPRDAPRVPLREVEIRFVRSSGPGGQNVNKLNTKAVLRWPVFTSQALPAAVRERFLSRYARRITKEGDLVMASDRFRDQARNAADCVTRLQDMIDAVALPPRVRKPTRATAGARERRLTEKRQRAHIKEARKRVHPDREH